MCISTILGRTLAAARAFAGLAVPEQGVAVPHAAAGAGILGLPPVRARAVQGSTIKFFYKISDAAVDDPARYTLMVELPGPVRFDLKEWHRTVVATLPQTFWLDAAPTRLLLLGQYEDAAGNFQPLDRVSLTLYEETYAGGESQRGVLGGPHGVYFDTSTFSVLDERGTYRTVRFFAKCAIEPRAPLGREFDPLVILVPRRP